MAASRDFERVNTYLQSRNPLFTNSKRHPTDGTVEERPWSSGSESRPASSNSDRSAGAFAEARRGRIASGRDADRAKSYLNNTKPLFQARRRTFAEAQSQPLFGADANNENIDPSEIPRAKTAPAQDRLATSSRRKLTTFTTAYERAALEEAGVLDQKGGEFIVNGDFDVQPDASPSPAPARAWGSRAKVHSKWLRQNLARVPDSYLDKNSSQETRMDSSIEEPWADLDFTARSGQIMTSPKLEVREFSDRYRPEEIRKSVKPPSAPERSEDIYRPRQNYSSYPASRKSKEPVARPPPHDEQFSERTILEEEGEAIDGTPVTIFKGAAGRPEWQPRHKRDHSDQALRQLAKVLSPESSTSKTDGSIPTNDGNVVKAEPQDMHIEQEARQSRQRLQEHSRTATKTEVAQHSMSRQSRTESKERPHPALEDEPATNVEEEPEVVPENDIATEDMYPQPQDLRRNGQAVQVHHGAHRKRPSGMSTPPRSEVDPEERIAAEASLFELVDNKSESGGDEYTKPSKPALINTAKLPSVKDDLREIIAEMEHDDTEISLDAGEALDRIAKRLGHDLTSIRDAKEGLTRLETQVSISPPAAEAAAAVGKESSLVAVQINFRIPKLWARTPNTRLGFQLTWPGFFVVCLLLWLIAEDCACTSYCRLPPDAGLPYWEPINPAAPVYGLALPYAAKLGVRHLARTLFGVQLDPSGFGFVATDAADGAAAALGLAPTTEDEWYRLWRRLGGYSRPGGFVHPRDL